VFVTEAELKKHLDAAEESPKQIAAAVLGLPERTLRYVGLLGMVLGEPIGTWVHTRKVDVSQAASVCLVGESYDSAASARNASAVSPPEVVEQTK
jgi:hypothetical protein